ncbi:FkbM family methyltransferase [Bacteroidota bacterium]
MKNIETNQDRTKEYLNKFNREKTIKYLLKTERPIIFDVGANNGSSAKEFKQWWPKAIIHCFEPQKECWFDLDVLENKYIDNSIVVNKYAVGNVPIKEATFYTHDITTGQSGLNKINLQSEDSIQLDKLKQKNDLNDLNKYKQSLNKERSVEIVRLYDYMNQKNIENVNVLKIDTQGFEPEVLDGLGKRLSDIDLVITELMFYDFYERSLSFSDIEKYLLPSGFNLYDISHISKNPMNGRTDWVDVIYINNRMRKAPINSI